MTLELGKDERLPLMLLTAGCRTTVYGILIISTMINDRFTPPASNIPLTEPDLAHVGHFSTRLLCHMNP